MQSTANEFLAKELREAEMAKPGAKILCFEGRDLRDSASSSLEASETEQYDLICVDNLVEKLRTSERTRELMATLFSGLGPGGRLLVSSEEKPFTDDAPDAQAFSDLVNLSSHIPEGEISGRAVFRGPAGDHIFWEIYKKVG